MRPISDSTHERLKQELADVLSEPNKASDQAQAYPVLERVIGNWTVRGMKKIEEVKAARVAKHRNMIGKLQGEFEHEIPDEK